MGHHLVEWPDDLLAKVRLEVDHLNALDDQAGGRCACRKLGAGHPSVGGHGTLHGAITAACGEVRWEALLCASLGCSPALPTRQFKIGFFELPFACGTHTLDSLQLLM